MGFRFVGTVEDGKQHIKKMFPILQEMVRRKQEEGLSEKQAIRKVLRMVYFEPWTIETWEEKYIATNKLYEADKRNGTDIVKSAVDRTTLALQRGT